MGAEVWCARAIWCGSALWRVRALRGAGAVNAKHEGRSFGFAQDRFHGFRGLNGFRPRRQKDTKNKATENTESTEGRLEKLTKFTAEIAETAGEHRGIEIRLRRGCLAGEAWAETRNPKHDPSALLRTRIRNAQDGLRHKFKMRMFK
jgi:hypothetical protein